MNQLLLLVIVKAFVLMHPNAFNKEETNTSHHLDDLIKVTTVSYSDQTDNIISNSAKFSSSQNNTYCYDNLDELVYEGNDNKQEVEKIRTEYAKIEREKTTYYKYTKLASSNKTLIPVEFGDHLSFIQGEHKTIKDQWPIDAFNLRRNKGGEVVHFYFDQDFDLRLITLNQFDHWDGFWNTTLSFYFAKKAKSPFFFFMNSKSDNYRDYDETMTTYTEDRVYYKIDSTHNDNDCPLIIWALHKKTEVLESQAEKINPKNTRNKPMEAESIQKFAIEILTNQYGTKLDQFDILVPVEQEMK